MIYIERKKAIVSLGKLNLLSGYSIEERKTTVPKGNINKRKPSFPQAKLHHIYFSIIE